MKPPFLNASIKKYLYPEVNLSNLSNNNKMMNRIKIVILKYLLDNIDDKVKEKFMAIMTEAEQQNNNSKLQLIRTRIDSITVEMPITVAGFETIKQKLMNMLEEIYKLEVNISKGNLILHNTTNENKGEDEYEDEGEGREFNMSEYGSSGSLNYNYGDVNKFMRSNIREDPYYTSIGKFYKNYKNLTPEGLYDSINQVFVIFQNIDSNNQNSIRKNAGAWDVFKETILFPLMRQENIDNKKQKLLSIADNLSSKNPFTKQQIAEQLILKDDMNATLIANLKAQKSNLNVTYQRYIIDTIYSNQTIYDKYQLAYRSPKNSPLRQEFIQNLLTYLQ